MFSLLFCIYEKQLRISGIRPRVKRQEKYYISPGLFFLLKKVVQGPLSVTYFKTSKKRELSSPISSMIP